MFVENFVLKEQWQEVISVNTGDNFYLQNPTCDCEYIVETALPEETERGGVLPQEAQLKYQEISGHLYMRAFKGFGGSLVHIEKEEA